MGDNHINERLRQARIGETNYNFRGQKMVIITYNNHNDITVQFDNGNIREHVHYCSFKEGNVRDYDNPDVYGIGITGTIPKKVNGKLTKEYSIWMNILQRCYDPAKWIDFPHYKDCSISEEWIHFSDFNDWCHAQENWDKVIANSSSFHIDKDIIVKGNKIYGADYCNFVPANVNVMFVKRQDMRGDLPIGVSTTTNGRYRSRCSMKNIGEKEANGVFDTPEEAFAFYKRNKERLIKEVAKKEYEQGNIVKRCYEAMLKYEVEITD